MKPIAAALSLLALAPTAAPRSEGGPPAGERPRNVAIVVYPGVELLDFAGPGEVFAVVRHAGRRPFRVYTVARTREPVTSLGFVEVRPQYTFDDCPPPDVVVLPGGSVPLSDEALRRWIVERASSAELVMSVCNGALVLGAVGLLDGLEVTTHHGSLGSLALLAPEATVSANRRFVDHGRVLTSAGISAGIDGALHVVARMVGEDAARATARYMEYDWRPEDIAALHAEPGRRPEDGSSELAARLERDGREATVAWYRTLEERPSERELNRAGYTLLSVGQADRAVAVFRLVAALFPDSSNACDSLSDALERLGQREESLAWSRRALERAEREPDLSAERRAILENAAASRVARLEGEHARLRFTCPPCAGSCDEQRFLRATRCPGCSMELVEVDAGDASPRAD